MAVMRLRFSKKLTIEQLLSKDIMPTIKTNQILFAVLLFLVVASAVTACKVYRPEINQGQAIEYEAVSKVKIGMTQEEVRAILGTPLIQDLFNLNRWDYVYKLVDGDRAIAEETKITILFENEVVKSIDHDIQPDEEKVVTDNPEDENDTDSVEAVPEAEETTTSN